MRSPIDPPPVRVTTSCCKGFLTGSMTFFVSRHRQDQISLWLWYLTPTSLPRCCECQTNYLPCKNCQMRPPFLLVGAHPTTFLQAQDSPVFVRDLFSPSDMFCAHPVNIPCNPNLKLPSKVKEQYLQSQQGATGETS